MSSHRKDKLERKKIEIDDVLSKENARSEWKNALFEGVEFDKDVDIDQIVKLYPLKKEEIYGAVERACKLARGTTIGEPVQRKPRPHKAIRISNSHLRQGIVWALGDSLLIERTKRKKEEFCSLVYLCELDEHLNFECWKKNGYNIEFNSFCELNKNFKCPADTGFECKGNLFRCGSRNDFIFWCGDPGEKKFECVHGDLNFECWRGKKNGVFMCLAEEHFDCGKINNRTDVFKCINKEKEFTCPENVKFQSRPVL